MSIQDAYSYRASSDSYLIDGHSYQCICVLHAILLPSGYLTLSTIAPYTDYIRLGKPGWHISDIRQCFEHSFFFPNKETGFLFPRDLVVVKLVSGL
jgi:hypothetical protein